MIDSEPGLSSQVCFLVVDSDASLANRCHYLLTLETGQSALTEADSVHCIYQYNCQPSSIYAIHLLWYIF